MKVLNKEHLLNPAYIAGIIDSDGSISICKRHIKRKTPNYTVMVQLSWVKSELVEKTLKNIKNQFGGSVCESEGRGKSRFKNGRSVFRYSVTGINAKNLLEIILPFLCLKQKQANNAIKTINIINDWQKNKVNNKRPDEVTNKLNDLYFKNKKLNTKNGKEKYHEST